MNISVVIPLFNEEESLQELCALIDKVMVENSFLYEVILIDDEALRKTFPDKPWTKPKVEGVTPLRPNDIRTEEERNL